MEGWKRVSSFNLSVFLGVSSDLQWSPARSSQRSTQSGSLPPAPSLLRWQCVRTNRRLRVPHVSRMYSVFRSLYVTWPTPDRRLMLVKSPKYLAVSPPAVSTLATRITVICTEKTDKITYVLLVKIVTDEPIKSPNFYRWLSKKAPKKHWTWHFFYQCLSPTNR